MLQTYCAGCHGGGKAAKGGFGFVLDRDRLVGRQLVVPGKPSASDLVLRIENGEMPPPEVKQRPTLADLKVLKQWIDGGAPAFDKPFHIAKVLSPIQRFNAYSTAALPSFRALSWSCPRQSVDWCFSSAQPMSYLL